MIRRPRRNIHLFPWLSGPQRETFGLYLGKLRVKRRGERGEWERWMLGRKKEGNQWQRRRGSSSRWEDVWAGGVHSVCECNYCRCPESECQIRSPLLWPNFIQPALHSQRRVLTKAGVLAEWAGVKSAATATPQPSAGTWTCHWANRNRITFISSHFNQHSCFSESPQVCNQNPPTEAPLVPFLTDTVWCLSQTMFVVRPLEIFNGVQWAINLAGGSSVNSDSAVLIPALCLLAEVTRIPSTACKGVNNVNTVN